MLLLDDCLSAVDAETAAHVSRELFLTRGRASSETGVAPHLMADRTIVLVSHQVQLVAPMADRVVVLEEGRLKFEGKSDDFLRSDLYHGLVEEAEAHEDQDDPQATELTAVSTPSGSATPSESHTRAEQSPILKDADVQKQRQKQPDDSESTVATSAPDEASHQSQPKSAKTKEEARAVGAVRWSIYRRYLDAAGGNSVALGILAVYIIAGFYTIVVGVSRISSPNAYQVRN